MMKNDIIKIRDLAKEYSEIAFSEQSKERVERYKKLNDLQKVRPPVLVFEVPWGEIRNCDELKMQCEDSKYHGYEWHMRANLYQWKHFQGDYAVHPYFRVGVSLSSSDTGLHIKEKVITSDTGAYIMSHEYSDVLADEEAIDKVKIPEITLNKEATQRSLDFANELFEGIMPVKKVGVDLYFASWDEIPRYHGVDNCLCDLYDRPEFAHKLMEKFTQIHEHQLDCYEKLNVLGTDLYYLHCTPACTYDLPVKDLDKDIITAKDVWCRAMAQLFAVVSPEMHQEFDLQYTKRLFERCGLAYYGCCEPLDNKIDILKQFKNLRRISITPWANVDVAAEKIGSNYVLSYKSNPAFLASKVFDPEPVILETKKVLEACKRNNTTCEFILKDISTVHNNAENLTKWSDTVNSVIDLYY